MTREHLASLDQLIARHLSVVEHLRQARDLIAGPPAPPDGPSDGPETKMLTGPEQKQERKQARKQTRQSSRRNAPAAGEGDAIIMDLDGVDITVTAAQGRILELLGENDGYLTAAAIGARLSLSAATVKRLINNLRARIAKAGCKCQVNGYRKRGFRLEAEGEAP